MARTKHSPASSVRIEEHVDGIVSSIGPKVKKLRQEQRLSLQQLAIKAEVSAAAIHKIERNDMVPTITTLLKIATALDRAVTYFVEDEGYHEPVAFTPAEDRPEVFTPHEGLTLKGRSNLRTKVNAASKLIKIEETGGNLPEAMKAPKTGKYTLAAPAAAAAEIASTDFEGDAARRAHPACAATDDYDLARHLRASVCTWRT